MSKHCHRRGSHSHRALPKDPDILEKQCSDDSKEMQNPEQVDEHKVNRYYVQRRWWSYSKGQESYNVKNSDGRRMGEDLRYGELQTTQDMF